jgi:hypothetical protein
MKKLAGAILAGLVFAASQAAAAGTNSDVVSVGDRIDGQGDGGGHFMHASTGAWVGLAVLAGVIAIAVTASERHDHSTSP